MSANVVVILLLVCISSKVDGAVLHPTDQPQHWPEFIASVNQKITKMESQLTAKELRINELETKLENHIAVFTKYVNDKESEIQMKNSEINQLKQQLSSLTQRVSEMDTSTRDVGRRVSDLEQSIHADRVASELNRGKSTELNVNIGEAPAGGVSKQNNITNDVGLNVSTISRVSADDIPHEDRALARSQIRAVPYTSVAFHVELTHTIPVSSGVIVVYDHEVLDEGSGYNPTDGIYVVPESGTYVITWRTCSNYNDYTQTYLIVNGRALGSSFADSDEIHDLHTSTAIVVLKLSRGDHLFIRVRHNQHGIMFSSIDHSAKATFSGWKLF